MALMAGGRTVVGGPARSVAQALAGALWLSACLFGAYSAMRFDFQPGRLGPRQAEWPPAARGLLTAARSPGQTTVMAFLHPRCICTRATVKHLVEVMRAHPDAGLTVALYVPPEDAGDAGWRGSDHLAAIESAVPGARIIWDRGGAQARTFGALTSGTILVYDADAREVFRGGITDRRGGEGANAGLDRLTRVLAGEQVAAAEPSPVFGCSLVGPDRAPGEGGT